MIRLCLRFFRLLKATLQLKATLATLSPWQWSCTAVGRSFLSFSALVSLECKSAAGSSMQPFEARCSGESTPSTLGPETAPGSSSCTSCTQGILRRCVSKRFDGTECVLARLEANLQRLPGHAGSSAVTSSQASSRTWVPTSCDHACYTTLRRSQNAVPSKCIISSLS